MKNEFVFYRQICNNNLHKRISFLMRKILSILFLVNFIILQANDFNDYGLRFISYENRGKDRTSLVLNNNQPFDIEKEISLSFDLLPRKGNVFGNVVRIVSNTNENITMGFIFGENNKPYPCISINDDFYSVSDNIEYNNWTSVSITISTIKDSLDMLYNGVRKSFPLKCKNWENIKVSFGRCPFPGFETAETAPINVKNIKIQKDEKLVRHWALGQHNGDTCYDLIKNVPAIAENPLWLIDRHIYWTEIYSGEFNSSDNPQYAYNQNDDLFYIVPDEKSVIIYNPVTNKYNIIPVKGGGIAATITNELIYDHLNNELVSYSLDKQLVSKFSFESQAWENKASRDRGGNYFYHTASIGGFDSCLVSFGGYGQHTYKNDLFKLDLRNNVWEKKILDSITPRYSAASAIIGNEFYIFGGRGSKSGKQEVNPRYYYDLYSVDLNSYEVKTIWKTTVDSNFLPSGSMVYNSEDSCFYVLATQGDAVVYRISRSEPKMLRLSVGIPQISDTDDTFRALFYSPNLKKMFVLFCKIYKKDNSKIIIYEINYPPLSLLETSQTVSTIDKSYKSIILIIAVVFIIIGGGMLLLIKKKKYGNEKELANVSNISLEEKKEEEIKVQKSNSLEFIRKEEGSNILDFKKNTFDKSQSRINLLGVFNIIDKNGIDITGKFAPKLKSLFLLLLLYTEKDQRGITNDEIEEMLWIDKDKEAARNNRSVYLRKLQLLLKEVGNIEIEKKNRFRKIKIKDDTFCDYIIANKYITEALLGNSTSAEFKEQLMELIAYGPLLPKTDFEWLDRFKAEYSGLIIDVAEKLVSSGEYHLNDSLKLHLADIIFMHDNLNEFALRLKCSIFYKEGKKGMAKNIYDSFCRDYLKSMGETYNVSFGDLLFL